MNTIPETPFLQYLRTRLATGAFTTDEAIACVLPLLRQTIEAHAQGKVAPLDGVERLFVAEEAAWFKNDLLRDAKLDRAAILRVDRPASRAFEIVGQRSRLADLDDGTTAVESLRMGNPGEAIERPVYLPGYRAWEHALGHHDALTDIFSLGMLLASVACGLDLTERLDLEKLVRHRENFFALHAGLNPVVAKTIFRMTELVRQKRAQDLPALVQGLERYREQEADPAPGAGPLQGFQQLELKGRRETVLAKLRDRLFEISRRNRLLYFKPSLQSLNLTLASVPLAFDVASIRPDQLFTWQGDVAAQISAGKPVPLGKYLRFEDAPYIPEVLDRIASEARRDQAEYGFAQLRLIVCFLRWHNLKEAPAERIDSPLLLLPVKLSKKKGVRDSYIVEPQGTVAEVNPVLRHHLSQLYGIDLPVAIDLAETAVDTLHEFLAAKIQASEPGVTVNKIDRPQVELIYERARRRLDQYQRGLRLAGGAMKTHGDIDYSYDRDCFRPLGLRLFEARVRPVQASIGDFFETPRAAWDHAVEPAVPPRPPNEVERHRRVAAIRDGGPANPYSWDFDLCSLTIGNFRYRKMSLVRDYESLLDEKLSDSTFESIFTTTPRALAGKKPDPAPLEEQFPVVACDPTQTSAIDLARSGRSFIIQGPPGTGKSQTITNLIADFAARGKHVLFVCEKRAALDVVYYRLKQHGLDAISCLIHDSQTDKKEFILDLKKTYESFLQGAGGKEADLEGQRLACVKGMSRELEPIRRHEEILKSTPPGAGLPLCRLLHRRVEVDAHVPAQSAAERERVPAYGLWEEYRQTLERIGAAMGDLREDAIFANHPLRLLLPSLAEKDRPIETVIEALEKARAALDGVEASLERTGLPRDQWDEHHEALQLVAYAVRVRPYVERGQLALLEAKSEMSRGFGESLSSLRSLREEARAAEQASGPWKKKLTRAETSAALEQARAFEKKWLCGLRPSWWRLRRVLASRYDFASHAVVPSCARVLEALEREHAAAEALAAGEAAFQRSYGAAGGFEPFVKALEEARELVQALRGPARLLHERTLAEAGAAQAILAVADAEESLKSFRSELDATLLDYQDLTFPQVRAELERIGASLEQLPDFLPVLADVAKLPLELAAILRRAPEPLERIEAAMVDKSLQDALRGDRFLAGFSGPLEERHLGRLDSSYEKWLEGNAACVIDRIRRELRRKAQVASLPAGSLKPEEKQLKQGYSAGRRELEHEFGKSMRYKSIRELLGMKSGDVILDLKPVWLMSPLSVSDTLPIDVQRFDVVIFDEASQIPVEHAIPSVFRGPQIIVVGDEMQLPPTNFFAARHHDDDDPFAGPGEEAHEQDLESTSFLNHASRILPATMLGWHYRSRSEALIGFSNAAFYRGGLLTVPDRRLSGDEREKILVIRPEDGEANVERLLSQSLSFHQLEKSPYENRRNAGEAAYIARLTRAVLRKKSGLTVGIIAFSEAQQDEIERALEGLAKEDDEFAELLEAEREREENDQFVGLLVKNLENIQGDERDLVILSICYGPARDGRMLMSFGPINQAGGEKRLNVAFSRAKRHMAVVSSIQAGDIKNVHNDGATCLRSYLEYAEGVSAGDAKRAARVLEGMRIDLGDSGEVPAAGAVAVQIAGELRARGYEVDLGVGQSRFRCDLAVRRPGEAFYRAAVDVDTPDRYEEENLLERALFKPRILRAFDWQVCHVLAKDWIQDRKSVLDRIESAARAGAREKP